MYQYDQGYQAEVQDPFGYNRGGMETFDPYNDSSYQTAAALYGGDCLPPWIIPTFPTEPTLS